MKHIPEPFSAHHPQPFKTPTEPQNRVTRPVGWCHRSVGISTDPPLCAASHKMNRKIVHRRFQNESFPFWVSARLLIHNEPDFLMMLFLTGTPPSANEAFRNKLVALPNHPTYLILWHTIWRPGIELASPSVVSSFWNSTLNIPVSKKKLGRFSSTWTCWDSTRHHSKASAWAATGMNCCNL